MAWLRPRSRRSLWIRGVIVLAWAGAYVLAVTQLERLPMGFAMLGITVAGMGAVGFLTFRRLREERAAGALLSIGFSCLFAFLLAAMLAGEVCRWLD
jgi:hypothetical protein